MDTMMKALKETIEHRYGCFCRHAGMTHVCEQAEGGGMWEGEVQTFELIGHSKATMCFAWNVSCGEGMVQQVTALSPPIKSPAIAVKVYLIGKGKRGAA